jgi:hypothetical protein
MPHTIVQSNALTLAIEHFGTMPVLIGCALFVALLLTALVIGLASFNDPLPRPAKRHRYGRRTTRNYR